MHIQLGNLHCFSDLELIRRHPTLSTSSKTITLPKHLLTPLAILGYEYGNKGPVHR